MGASSSSQIFSRASAFENARRKPATRNAASVSAGARKPVQPAAGPVLQLVERRALGERHEQRQQVLDPLRLLELAPDEAQAIRPPRREPVGRWLEEAVLDRGARDAAVLERTGMADQIGAALESLEHPLDLRKQRAIVGVGAQEAERVVEAQDVRGAREARPRERRQQLPFAGGRAGAVQGARPFQIGDQPGRARASTPGGAGLGWRGSHGIGSDSSRNLAGRVTRLLGRHAALLGQGG